MKRALLLLLLSCACAEAAVVHLKDGRAVRGTVVSATARDLTLSTPEGTLTFDAANVSRVDYQDDLPPPAAAPPAPARYEFAPPKNELGLGIGFTVPLGHVDLSGAGGGRVANGTVGAGFGVSWFRRLDDKYLLGLSFDYLTRGGHVTDNGIPAGRTELSGDSVILLLNAKRSFPTGSFARPYVRLGLGGHLTSTILDAQPQPGFVWSNTSTDETRRLADGGAWGMAYAAGVGADFDLGASTFFGLDVGWTGLESAKVRPTAAGRALGLGSSSPRLHLIGVSGRWGWRF